MTRPTKFIGSVPMLGGPLGFAPEDVEPEIPPPIDRALGSNNFNGAVFTVNAPSTGGIVQTKIGAFSSGGAAITESFDTTPTNGNTMYAIVFSEGTTTSSIDTTGWAAFASGTANGDEVEGWKKVAGAAEPTAVHSPADVGGSARRLVLIEIAGSHDVSGSTTDDSAASPLTGPSITPGASAVLVAAFIGEVATYVADPTWTPQGDLVTIDFLRRASARLVTGVYEEDTTGSGPFVPTVTTTPLYAGRLTASIAWTTAATPTAVVWNVPADEVTDGNDVTYHEIDGPQVLRIDLGTAYTIISTRLLAGSATAQSVTYTITGANEADFSDGVVLGSITYNSTGSFTGDDETWSWHTDTAYRYFELDGTDENRRVYTWSLYEADITEGQDHTHDDLQDQIDDLGESLDEHVSDPTDAHDASAVSIVDAGGYYTGTDVEAALQEVGATVDGLGGHILLADGHATPFVFTDMLQMDDGSDFMWSD